MVCRFQALHPSPNTSSWGTAPNCPLKLPSRRTETAKDPCWPGRFASTSRGTLAHTATRPLLAIAIQFRNKRRCIPATRTIRNRHRNVYSSTPGIDQEQSAVHKIVIGVPHYGHQVFKGSLAFAQIHARVNASPSTPAAFPLLPWRRSRAARPQSCRPWHRR